MKIVPIINKEGNAGTPSIKMTVVILYPAEFIDKFPALTESTVKVAALPTLKDGGMPITIYATPGSISRKDTVSGDVDARGFTSELKFSFPGDTQAVNDIIQSSLNMGFVAVSVVPAGADYDCRIQGTVDNPMYMQVEEIDAKESVKKEFTLKQEQIGPFKMQIFKGALPELAPPSEATSI